ncbi:YhcB family protein [Gallaecimonas xiamenensis]|uniref:Z-ring associated protein G n=1 Tax=Gallaecimonas xiamenensis 3-C-1 TaxID=745411 RepID=K2JLR5_9GAMM|nr:YhcB family protein [Gallaecimonas xiamenensis]EKE71474.1 cytochrome d ubiquinol oxidase subunit III [Gallaecimonas xiamenensis 3-C-1]
MSIINYAICFVVGIVVGLVIGRLRGTTPLGEDKLRQELEQTQLDLEQYKEDVKDHFEESAEMMKQLAKDYDRLARHVSEGAGTLLSLDADVLSLRYTEEPEPEQQLDLLTEPPRDYSHERHGLIKK